MLNFFNFFDVRAIDCSLVQWYVRESVGGSDVVGSNPLPTVHCREEVPVVVIEFQSDVLWRIFYGQR